MAGTCCLRTSSIYLIHRVVLDGEARYGNIRTMREQAATAATIGNQLSANVQHNDDVAQALL
jgi:hypothetical protein